MRKTSLLALVVSLIALGVVVFAGLNGQRAEKKETTFERVLRTNTIRCGYAAWPPSLIIEPNTKRLSGYSYNAAEAVGEKLGLKIDWVE